jgi:hypothetical protein
MKRTKYGMGWQRDLPDIRDYSPEHEKIERLFHKSKALSPPKAGNKKPVDLTQWCRPSRTRANSAPAPPMRGQALLNITRGVRLGSTWMPPGFFFTR